MKKRIWLYPEIYILSLFLLLAIFAYYYQGLPYNKVSGDALLSPNNKHLLGTDDLGMDIFAQLLHGTNISLRLGIFTAFFAGVGGSLIGMIAGYFGGWLDKLVTAILDIFISVPDLPLMIVLGAFLGADLKNIIIVLVLVSWTHPAKIARSHILKLKKEKYIVLARAYRGSFSHIFRKHLLAIEFPIMVTSVIKIMNRAILSEASLAYLGLGDPLSKSWGMIISRAMSFPNIYFTDYYLWWLFPPLFLLILLVSSLASFAQRWEKNHRLKERK